ncbi:MAG: HlyD family type I secretion periplasmic adaptor subunit [Burkholderiales bacterium]
MSMRRESHRASLVDEPLRDGLSAGDAAPALPRVVIVTLAGFVVCVAALLGFGRLDVVTSAPGKLVPAGFVQIVQPRDGGVVHALRVREGDRVKAGQVIATLDARQVSADGDALERQRATVMLQLRRIDAELSGASLERRREDPPELFAQARQQFEIRRSTHAAALRAERAAVETATHEHEAAQARVTKLRQSVPLLKEQSDAWQQLLAEGFAGRLQAQERMRAYVEAARDLDAETARAAASRAELARAEERVIHLDRGHREQLHVERADAQSSLTRLEAEVAKHRVSRESLELRAPRDGVVKDLATHTVGAVVQAGTVLATLVPLGDALEAEVHVSQLDAGLVTPGKRVRVKVATYPFHRYGTVSGTVRHLSPDAADRAPPAADGTGGEVRSQPPAGYRSLVALDAQALAAEGRSFPLTAGMQVSAEIRLGTRSVLDYLLAPVARTLDEAGRER